MKKPGLKTVMALAIAAPALLGANAALADECVRGNEILATTAVYFEVDSTVIKPETQAQLKDIAQRYASHPSVIACALGQADKTGNADYNKKLALRRAEAVAELMKANGLGKADWQIKSRGESFGDAAALKRLFNDDLAFDEDRRVEVMVMAN